MQHAPHTLHFCRTDPHAAVPLSCPQLCGVTHVHESTHACAVCVPCGSGLHCPLEASQLYMAGGGVGGGGVGGGGVGGGGVGGGVGALHDAMHACALSAPCGSCKHCPLVGSQLYITGAGVGGAGVGGVGVGGTGVGGGVGGLGVGTGTGWPEHVGGPRPAPLHWSAPGGSGHENERSSRAQ